MKLLVAIGALVVIGAIALVLMMSKTDDAPATAQKPIARPASHQGSSVSVTSVDRGAQPALPAGSAVASTEPPKEYMVGDVKVRDHRTGEHKPLDLPPNVHPANGRELPSELTHDISQQVKRQLFECATAMPKEARGTKPKMEGMLTVAIKDHKLAVTGLTAQIRDVDGPSADALKQCVEQKSASFTSNAAKEPDVENYTIGLSFVIP